MFAPFGIVHIFYLLILGSCGWLATLYLTLFPVGTLLFPITYNTDLLCCFALAGCARLLAFRVQRKIPLALDSAFYIAIRYSFGTLTAVLCVAVILSLDAIIRYLYDKNFWIIPGDAPAIHMIAFPIYNGGLPALILLVLGVSFGDYPLEQFPDASLAWHVPVFGALFLVLHYLVSGVTAWLRGFASIKRWQEIWIDVVGAELMLIPLAVAMVLAYRHQGMALFLLIGAIGLLFNWVYRKGVKDRDNLEQRVSELSILNRLGVISASATNEKKLFSDLAKITLELVGSGSNFIIGLMDDKKGAHQGQFAYDFFDKKANWYTRQFYSANVGISGWAIRNRKEIRINNVGEEYSNYVSEPLEGPMGFQSCLAVPLIANDELIGVISVQSADYRAYTKQHLQVLTIIAQHIAINLQNTRLYQLATLDELTGLFVRRYFDQRLHEEWERARRYGSKFSLAIIDLDHFKNVNDTYGHPVGDEVLKQTGKIIGSNMRSFDIAARYGGEEFVFILPRTGLDGASEVAERIRKDLSNCVVHTSKGPLSVTASIGVTAFPDGDAHTSEELLTLADIALYESKHRGRNQVTLRTKAAHAKAAHAKAETSTHSKETTANSQSRLENTLDTVDMPAISNPSRV